MNEMGNILLTGFGLVLLWLVFYYGWRPYRIDRVRNDLFALRDELFIFAANGGVSFNDPAYRSLRNRINALVRNAHIISLSRIMIYSVADDYISRKDSLERLNSWVLSVGKLSVPTQEKIHKINDQVAIVLVRQVIAGSILLMPMFMVYLLLLKIVRHSSYESSRLRAAKELRVELIEEQAVITQAYEPELALSPVG
jgi:hypothetical protein